MDDDPAALARLYADAPGVVRRAGRTYPAAVTALPDATLRLVDRPADVDAALLAGGAAHLAAVRAGGRVHDGPVLCLDRVSGAPGAPVVEVVRGGYFGMLATCDALRAELLAAGPADGPAAGWDRLPLRARAHEVAGDPTTSGTGRVAAVGVSVLLVVRDDAGAPAVVLGRRSARAGLDAGRWHVAPSGMLEPAADGAHLATTVATELHEELGVDRDVAAVTASLRVLGLVTDLARLRPDVVVLLDAGPARPVPGPEFDALELVPLTADGLADLWRRRPPEQLTPAAAGALALAERL